MVRVASLKDMVNAKYTKKDIAGLTAAQQLDKLNVVTHELVAQQYSTYNRSLLPVLKAKRPYGCRKARAAEQGSGRICGRLF